VPRSRMRGAIPPLPQYVFMAWCLVKHRDNFTLPLWSPVSFFSYHNKKKPSECKQRLALFILTPGLSALKFCWHQCCMFFYDEYWTSCFKQMINNWFLYQTPFFFWESCMEAVFNHQHCFCFFIDFHFPGSSQERVFAPSSFTVIWAYKNIFCQHIPDVTSR
jgi:hypothetical protein